MWIDRDREESSLRDFLQLPAPAMALIRGARGAGRSALVRRSLPSGPLRWHTVTPLDPGTQIKLLRAAWLGDDAPTDRDDPAPFPLTDRLSGDREPTVLVLDDVDHLADPPAVAAGLDRLWHDVRAQGLPLHVLVLGTEAGLARLVDARPVLGEIPALDLTVGGLTARQVAGALVGWPSTERLLAWALFGGSPARLRHLDPTVRLATNVQRAFLDPSGTLHGAAPDLLARTFQKPERYATLVLALSRGAAEWGSLRDAVPDFTSSSQLAPYLASLEEHGLVEAHRSLDARPRSRNRRYSLADPFPGSWYNLVLPHRGRLALGDPAGVWRDHVRPSLDAWAARVFPMACRDFLRQSQGGPLPMEAREVGGLWGEGYDLPVAGTLRNGSPLYGRCVWGRTATLRDAEVLAEEVRATRYGFGREARIRAVFAAGGVDHDLRRQEARDPLLLVIELDTVLGL